MRARFAVDWDGTCVVDDTYPHMGDWLPGAPEALHALSRLGTVVIHSCRTAEFEQDEETPKNNAEQVAAIESRLAEHGLEGLEIWTRPYKPPAVAYIDNRGVHFDGDWEATLDRVLDLIAPMHEYNAAMGEAVLRERAKESVERHRTIEDDVFDVPLDPFWKAAYPDRHPSSERFHEILRELGELHDLKSVGYGTDVDPLANVRASEDWGIPGWQGAMIRGGDKVKRLQAFAQKGDLPFEAIEDAFKDLAVYAVIGLVLFEQSQGRQP